MQGDRRFLPARAYWLVIDSQTGQQLPPDVKFADRDEAAEYHRRALGEHPRYELRQVAAPPPIDPDEPRVW